MTFFSRKHLRLLLLPALLLLTGCAGSAKETADSTENEKLSAVATIFPRTIFCVPSAAITSISTCCFPRAQKATHLSRHRAI